MAAALERGVEYKVLKSHLQIQTERVSVHIGDALDMDLEAETKICPIEEIVLPTSTVTVVDTTEIILENVDMEKKNIEIIDPNSVNTSDSEDGGENEDGVETEIGFPVVF